VIEVSFGDSKQIDVVMRDKANNLAPFDLTGAVVHFTVKRTVHEADIAVVITKNSTGGGITITNASQGAFSIFLTPGDTSITAMDYVFDIRVTVGGNVFSETPGIFRVIPVVRRVLL